MSREKTIKMANQIASFFHSQPEDSAPAVAKHINDFWDPRMRAELIDLAKTDPSGLDPAVVEALIDIRSPTPTAG